MAAEVKKSKITVETMINPFAETKSKKVPEWTSLRPNAMKDVAPLFFKRTMELDGRKWKKPDIEKGIYAVARYELKLFATQISGYEKAISKAVSGHKPYKNKLPKTQKDEIPELTTELDKAAKDIGKLYKTIAKKIEDKVSLALDEVESDKGDNKKALATGKEALKRFDSLDTSRMFSEPTKTVVTALAKLNADLGKAKTEKESDAAFKSALGTMKKAETQFEKTGRTVGKVVKYLLAAGDKMAKDKKAAPELQAFGKKLGDGTTKKKLIQLDDMVTEFGYDLDEAVHFTAEGTADAAEAKSYAQGFAGKQSGADRAASEAVKEVGKLSKEFKTLVKDLK